MEDEKETTNQTGEAADTPNEEADKPLSIVDEAAKLRDEIRAENDRREKLLQEEQKLKAENMLGGTTGGHVEPEVKEETPQEYAKKVMANEL